MKDQAEFYVALYWLSIFHVAIISFTFFAIRKINQRHWFTIRLSDDIFEKKEILNTGVGKLEVMKRIGLGIYRVKRYRL